MNETGRATFVTSFSALLFMFVAGLALGYLMALISGSHAGFTQISQFSEEQLDADSVINDLKTNYIPNIVRQMINEQLSATNRQTQIRLNQMANQIELLHGKITEEPLPNFSP